jgi:DNA-binding transcriptional MerR regulator
VKRYSPEQIKTIRSLRHTGFTYREINQKLGYNVPKGSLSYLCAGITLPAIYHQRMTSELAERQKANRVKALRRLLELKEQRFESIRRKADFSFKSIQDRDTAKIALAMLHLGEGSKYKSYRGLSIGSTDPKILIFYLSAMDYCYGKKRESFKARVQHRADQKSEEQITFWSQAIGIQKTNFYVCSIDKRTIGKKTLKDSYHGVCSILSAGADIQLELESIAAKICWYAQNFFE